MAAVFLGLLAALFVVGVTAAARHDRALAWRRHVATALAVFDNPKESR